MYKLLFYQQFSQFILFKAKNAFERELLLRLCSFGFGLNIVCCPLSLQHSAHETQPGVGRIKLCYNITFYYRGFKQNSAKAQVSNMNLFYRKYLVGIVVIYVFNWKVLLGNLKSVSWTVVYISSYSTIKYAYSSVGYMIFLSIVMSLLM